MSHRLVIVALLSVATALPAGAQRLKSRDPQAQRQAGSDSGANRARLENEIRRGFARAVRQRVGLNDEQMGRLGPVAMKYEQQRRQLQSQERETRMSLRTALRNEQGADPQQVDGLLQSMLDIQKRRLQLLESEQRDLATIMTPVQRARYMALQEQIRRRLEQMRQRRQQALDPDAASASATTRRPGRRPFP